jgi:hypothetical protein
MRKPVQNLIRSGAADDESRELAERRRVASMITIFELALCHTVSGEGLLL